MAKTTSISLGNALDIAHAADLKKRMQQALSKDLPVVLVADKVEKIDTAGIQLVYAFIDALQNKGEKVSWRKPSGLLLEMSQKLAIKEALVLA